LALVWRKCHYLIQEPEAWTSGIKINMVEMISPNSRKAFVVVKGKTVLLQAWTGPEVSEEVKVPRFRDHGTGWW